MNPGGETEAALVSKLLKLPMNLPDKRKAELKNVNEMRPLYLGKSGSGAGVGSVTALGGGMLWQNSTPDDRDKIVRALDDILDKENPDYDYRDDCWERYQENLRKCNQVADKKIAAICRETAFMQYSQCVAKKPQEHWRDIHTWE